MRIVKRVVAWIMVVLSVIGMTAMVGGLVGSWIVRGQITDVTVGLLTVGETAVSSVTDGLNRIDTRLDVSQDNIAELESNITIAGENLTETSIVGTVISNNISEETAVSITEARATAVTIAESVVALDAAIAAANDIPFITLDGKMTAAVSDVADGLVQLDTNMAAFRAGAEERREERIDTSVDFFTGLTAEMSAGISGVQDNLNAADTRLQTTSANLADAKVTLPRLFTIITLFVNIHMLLIGLAFFSLLMHSWALAQNPDLTFRALLLTEKE